MGLIADTSVLIRGERGRMSVREILAALSEQYGREPIQLSVITIAELTHGIYRASSASQIIRRTGFLADVQANFQIHDVTNDVAALAGKIEGEQAALGISIGFEDILIGATALGLGYLMLTSDPRHFNLIPGLKVISC